MALEKGWLAKREQVGVKELRPHDILGLGRDAQVLVYDPGPIRFRHRLLQEFMTAWMLMMDEGLREKEIDRCAQEPPWWETLFLLGGLIGANNSPLAYSQFVQRVLSDGTSDQRLFAAIGLLRSVENPPAELANSIMFVFNNLVAVSEGLTEKQFAAAQELVRILGDEAAEAFGVLFHSPKNLFKEQGTRLLCSIKDKHANKILLAAFRDGDERETTTGILVSIGEEVVESLIAALKDSNKLVRKHVTEAQGKWGDSSVVESLLTVLNDSNDVHWRVVDVLAKIGKPAVKPLVDALNESDEDISWHAAQALGHMGDPNAVEPLIAALKHSDSDVRKYAAFALGKIGDPGAVAPFITALKDSDNNVRRHAVYALGGIGDPNAIGPLIAAVKDRDDGVRGRAAKMLRSMGDRRAVEPLIAALKDSEEWVRTRAVEAVGRIGDQRAVEPLIAALKDSADGVRWHAAEALGKMGGSAGVTGTGARGEGG